jgi:hypothetical protein
LGSSGIRHGNATPKAEDKQEVFSTVAFTSGYRLGYSHASTDLLLNFKHQQPVRVSLLLFSAWGFLLG